MQLLQISWRRMQRLMLSQREPIQKVISSFIYKRVMFRLYLIYLISIPQHNGHLAADSNIKILALCWLEHIWTPALIIFAALSILDRLLCIRGISKFVSKKTLAGLFKEVESVIIPSQKKTELRWVQACTYGFINQIWLNGFIVIKVFFL